MLTLGIETSCDETGVALHCSDRGLLAQALHSQVAMHERYGGVVPELASRDHVRRLLPLARQVLDEAGVGLDALDAIAYTEGPGLAGALLVGAAVAQSLGFALRVPTLGVHHLEGHLLSPLLSADPPAFPFVALLVSAEVMLQDAVRATAVAPGSTSYGRVAADPVGPGLDPDPKGFGAASQTEYSFFEPVFVDGRRQRWDAELAVRRGPVGLRAEYLQETEARDGQGPTLEDLPDVRGRGFQVAATWLVTGEKKTRTVQPRARLFRGPGAVEIGARYEEMRADDVDNQGFEGFGSRARNLRPAGYKAFTGGVSWWPTVFLRLGGNVVVERYRDALVAPETGTEGNYVSLIGRVQVMLP